MADLDMDRLDMDRLDMDRVQKLMLAVLGAIPDNAGMEEDEIRRCVEWMRGVEVEYAVVEAIKRGQICVRWPAGSSEPEFVLGAKEADRGRLHEIGGPNTRAAIEAWRTS